MISISTYHKEREYCKPNSFGAYTPGSLIRSQKNIGRSDGKWARPYPYFSFWTRVKQAWDVFKYRADALYWDEPRN